MAEIGKLALTCFLALYRQNPNRAETQFHGLLGMEHSV